MGWTKLPKFRNGGRWDWTTVPSIDSPAPYRATTAPHMACHMTPGGLCLQTGVWWVATHGKLRTVPDNESQFGDRWTQECLETLKTIKQWLWWISSWFPHLREYIWKHIQKWMASCHQYNYDFTHFKLWNTSHPIQAAGSITMSGLQLPGSIN